MFSHESRDSPPCPVRSPSNPTELTLRTEHGAQGRCVSPRDHPLSSAASSRETRNQRNQSNRLSVRPPSAQPRGDHAHPSDQPARAGEGRSRTLRGRGEESRTHCARSLMVGALKTRRRATRHRARPLAKLAFSLPRVSWKQAPGYRSRHEQGRAASRVARLLGKSSGS